MEKILLFVSLFFTVSVNGFAAHKKTPQHSYASYAFTTGKSQLTRILSTTSLGSVKQEYIPQENVRLKKIRVRKPAPTRKIFLAKLGYIELEAAQIPSPQTVSGIIHFFDRHISALLNRSLELRYGTLLI